MFSQRWDGIGRVAYEDREFFLLEARTLILSNYALISVFLFFLVKGVSRIERNI